MLSKHKMRWLFSRKNHNILIFPSVFADRGRISILTAPDEAAALRMRPYIAQHKK